MLGMDRPVDPMRARFALSILEEIEATPDNEDSLDLSFGRLPPLLQVQRNISKKTKTHGFRTAFTHLLAAVVASASTILLLIIFAGAQ
jgi:hypothetical protein